MRQDEWRRINAAAVKGFEMRSMLAELMDVYAAEHEHASPELKTAFDLLLFSLETLGEMLCGDGAKEAR